MIFDILSFNAKYGMIVIVLEEVLKWIDSRIFDRKLLNHCCVCNKFANYVIHVFLLWSYWCRRIGAYCICHSCRKLGHFLFDCPTKKQCPKCGNDIEKCIEVQKNTSSVGHLFFCYTRDCVIFKLKIEGESSGESSCLV